MIILDPASDTPLYKQLSTQIMKAIVTDRLSLNDALPSVRAFAGDLGVNMHTVNKSYHELESKGIIEIVPKKGAIIIADKYAKPTQDYQEDLHVAFQPLVVEALVNGLNEQDLKDVITSVIKNIKEE